MLHDAKKIDNSEYATYLNLWSMWKKVMPFYPDLFIYLKPSLNIVMERLIERNRSEEGGVDENYQSKLQIKHDKFFDGETVKISKSRSVPCLILNTNSNFRDDEIIQKKITEQIKSQIELLNEK